MAKKWCRNHRSNSSESLLKQPHEAGNPTSLDSTKNTNSASLASDKHYVSPLLTATKPTAKLWDKDSGFIIMHTGIPHHPVGGITEYKSLNTDITVSLLPPGDYHQGHLLIQ